MGRRNTNSPTNAKPFSLAAMLFDHPKMTEKGRKILSLHHNNLTQENAKILF
jgi:hypothetical protein